MEIKVCKKFLSSHKLRVIVNGEVKYAVASSNKGACFKVFSSPTRSLKCIGTWNPKQKESCSDNTLCFLDFIEKLDGLNSIRINKIGLRIQIFSNGILVGEGLMGRRNGEFSKLGIRNLRYTLTDSLVAEADDLRSECDLLRVCAVLVYLYYSNCLT